MSYSCTNGEACVACGKAAHEFHHVMGRKAYPQHKDEPRNLAPMCRTHHSEIHSIGRSTFAKRYTRFYVWLVENKWNLCALTNKWYLN